MKTLSTRYYIDLYNAFNTFIKVKQYKTGRGMMYQLCVAEFFNYLEKNSIMDLTLVDGQIVQQYYDYLSLRPSKRGGSLSQNTLNHHLFALKLLFHYCLDEGLLEEMVVLPGYQRGIVDERPPLSREEIALLFAVCRTQTERALLAIVYGCGLRRSEIEDLNTKDILFTDGILIVREGKNTKRREIPLSESVIQHLKSYYFDQRVEILQHHKKYEEAFFLSSNGKRLTGMRMNSIVKNLALRTENNELIKKHVCLHLFRHTIATHLSENGAQIEFIRDFLGHTLINTSQLYAIRQLKSKKMYAY